MGSFFFVRKTLSMGRDSMGIHLAGNNEVRAHEAGNSRYLSVA